MNEQFLPICRADMLARGWQEVDFVVVMGDCLLYTSGAAPPA